MRFLRHSTSVDVPIGPFLDSTDGVTAETGLTITQADIRLKKNGGAWAQKNAAQTLSHEENGFYEVTLNTTDTNTLGHLRLAVFESGALPVWEDFEVVSTAVWDALFSNGNFPANMLAINSLSAPAVQLERGATALVTGACVAGSSTTNVLTNLLEATDNHYNGRTITFTTGALLGQSSSIEDYVGSTKALTVVQLTEAPANTDEFVIS